MVSSTDILNAKILVVDDQAANILLLEGMLRIAGYTSIESTSNPSEVCELHRKNRYSLILLDLQMPVMDGFQVMEGLREIEDDAYLPVIVITAQPDHKLRALQAGAKDFVSKPFDLAELRARVHNILEVRLLHQKTRTYSKALEETVRELEARREELRLKTLEEQKRNEQELALAQETQQSLLPRCLPQFGNFDVHAFNSPTRYVGGDFYDFLQLDSGEWLGVLADVSGKGMPAALLSSMVLGALRMELTYGTELQEALNRLNRLIFDKSLAYQFVTLFLLRMSPNGTAQFIGAGHNPAYLFRSSTGKIEELPTEGNVLGLFDSASFPPGVFSLEKGDILVVYSDGLTDAQNPEHDMFGDERLTAIIRKEARQGSRALQEKILKAVEQFTQNTPQSDDITLVTIEKR